MEKRRVAACRQTADGEQLFDFSKEHDPRLF